MLVPCIGFRGVRYIYQVLSTFTLAFLLGPLSHALVREDEGQRRFGEEPPPARLQQQQQLSPRVLSFPRRQGRQQTAAPATAPGARGPALWRQHEPAAVGSGTNCSCEEACRGGGSKSNMRLCAYFLFSLFFSWLVARRGRSGSAGQRERLLGAPACGHGAKQQQEQHLGGSQHLVSAAKATRPCNLLLPPPRTSLWVYNNCPRLTPCG